MNALMRYVLMKGMRDQIIMPLLFGPSLLFVSPLLVSGIVRFFQGGDAWPVRLPGSTSPAETAHILTLPAMMFGTVVAGVAAFWIFRTEISGRTVGFFLLAQPAIVPVSVTMLFGTVMGTLSSAIGVVLISLLTGSPVPMGPAKIAAGAVAIAFAAALGTLSVGISAQLGILLPATVASIVATAYLLDTESALLAAAAIGGALAVTFVAAFVWRRRCAI